MTDGKLTPLYDLTVPPGGIRHELDQPALTAREAKAAASYIHMAIGQMKHRAPRERARVIAEKLRRMGGDEERE